MTPSTLGGARTLACSHYLSTNAMDTVLPFCDSTNVKRYFFTTNALFMVYETQGILNELSVIAKWCLKFSEQAYLYLYLYLYLYFTYCTLYISAPAMAKWWLPISDHANPSAEPFYPNYPSLSSHYQCFHVIMKEWPDYIRDQTEEPNFATVSIVQKYPKRLLIQFGPIFTKLNPTWYLIWEIDCFSAEQNGLGHLKQFWVTWFSKRKWGDQLASPQGRSTQNWEN